MRRFTPILILVVAIVTGKALAAKNSDGLKKNPFTAGMELTPVILIPGKGGSQLEARYHSYGEDNDDYEHINVNGSRLNATCERLLRRKQGWYRMWMDVWQLFPGEIECWADSMELHYSEACGYSTNAPGVEVRVPGWGQVETIEYLDPSMTAWILGTGNYMANFIHELERWGYTRGKNLRGAPYDFRYSPHSQAAFFRRLQHLIEDTYYINGRKKVALITHSMGGLFATYFLNMQTAEWKDRFIETFVTINTPWAGTAYMPKMMASGTDFGVKEINPLAMRRQQRSYETSPLLLPHLETWGADRVLVKTTDRNFTANDYLEFFDDIDYEYGDKRFAEAAWDQEGFDKHPGVAMYCLYSTGIKTVESVTYDGEYDDQPTKIEYGDGDGTVNRRSLVGCSKFYDSAFPFHMRHYRNKDHNSLLNCRRLYKQMRYILVHF